jgi:hypothetical protein
MNERIKELAKQALKLVADDVTKGDVSRLNTDSYHVKDLINEKFAELIVEQCIIYAEREWIRNGDTEHNRAVTKVIESIKAHFGVKE